MLCVCVCVCVLVRWLIGDCYISANIVGRLTHYVALLVRFLVLDLER